MARDRMAQAKAPAACALSQLPGTGPRRLVMNLPRKPQGLQKSNSILARFVQAFRPIIQVGSLTMKRLKILGFALAAAFGVSGAHAEELTGTLKNIKETGAITLGFRDSSIPFSYLDDNQKPVGFAMDICYKIVDAVKKELKLDK